MGVSGAGKSTIGAAVAATTGADFVEGDDLHPPGNRRRMARGVPLTDADRAPWLDAVAGAIADHLRRERDVVVACSALRRSYRDRLREVGPVRFVFLEADPDELRERVEERSHPFMAPELLADQLAVLEDPRGEPDVVAVAPAATVEATVAAVLAALDTPAGG